MERFDHHHCQKVQHGMQHSILTMGTGSMHTCHRQYNFSQNWFLHSIYRGELSFLQPVHFCICWRDSAILISYLFQQWLACMHVPNWKNVLGVSAVYDTSTPTQSPIYSQ